jgi:hypothetical protein
MTADPSGMEREIVTNGSKGDILLLLYVTCLSSGTKMPRSLYSTVALDVIPL